MILLDSNPINGRSKNRFFFDRRWLKKKGLEQVVKRAWEEEQTGSNMYKVHRKIANCRIAILKWRNNFQGNARKKIESLKKLLGELQDIECEDKQERKKALKMQLKEAYDEEELF